jgi:hypothetical protein
MGCILVAMLLPVAVFIVQLLIWPLLSPYAWMMFVSTVLHPLGALPANRSNHQHCRHRQEHGCIAS